FHQSEYQRLRGELEAAHESSTLPDLTSEETRAALNGGGRSWIRTSEGVSQQIYSLPPLATWVSYHPPTPPRERGLNPYPSSPLKFKVVCCWWGARQNSSGKHRSFDSSFPSLPSVASTC